MMKKTKKLIDVPVYHIVQQFLNAKYDNKECAKTAARLKYSVTSASLSQALDRLFQYSKYYKEILWGHLFPEDVCKLGESNYHFFQSENILGDLNWLYIQINKNAKKLSLYFELRDDIERDILIGYYDDALDKLEKIRKRLGVSIWYYEMRMLIYSYTNNEKKNLHLLSDINEKKKDSQHGFVSFLLSFLYKRCSKSHSAYAFDAELESRFNMNRTAFQKARYNYYLFRLNYYQAYQIDDLSPILIMEATNSLIDRYNVMTYTLKAAFANTENEMKKQLCSDIASKFYRKTCDCALSSLVAYKHINILENSYYNNDLINILNTYYSGQYLECIEKCRDFVRTHPPLFDVVKIYCKSLLLSHSTYKPLIGNIDSILNRISNLMFRSMSQTDNYEILSTLYQVNKNIYGLSFANGLNDFVNKESNSKRNETLKYLSLNYFDPFYCGIFATTESKQKYMNACKSKFTKSFLVLEYQEARNRHSISEIKKVAAYIKDMDSAKLAYNDGHYEVALDLWLEILEKYKTILPIVQNAIEYIYLCYQCLDRKQDAISLYVNYYLEGRAYVSRIDTKLMENSLYKEKYKRGVRNGLDLQIFVFLASSEEERKGCVLERYCAYKDVEEVSNLLPELDFEKNRKKVEFYLYLLATEDILRHLVYVDSTKKMLEEQQKIANYLASIETSENLELYKSLNQELADTMIVFQNAKKIDESKIFVNQSALLKYELKEYESLYLQFKNQLSLSSSTNSFYIVNTSAPFPEDFHDGTLIHAQVKFTNKAFIDSSCQVFNVIREKFLFSKFGMKTYLSTRIRHGVLEGVLRSGLDSLHLVLLTENNKYVPISYWKKKYGLLGDEQMELMKILERFSKGINNEIERFKEEVLQIKLDDTDKGLLDFRLTPDDMCFATVSAETKSKTYDDFCMLIMEYLLRVTNANLINIRREINNSLKQKFISLIDVVSQDIIRFSSNRRLYEELNRTVADARADINQKIAQIEKWFYLQDAKFDDFSLIKHIDVVWNITHKMYPNIECKVAINGHENDVTIKSAYFIHVSDILTIFFNNMLSYSKPSPLRCFSISLNPMDNGFLSVTFENDIKEPEDVLNAKFKEMLQTYSRLQEEGRSGLVKVKKILKYDLGCPQNEIYIEATSGKCITRILINLKDIII